MPDWGSLSDEVLMLRYQEGFSAAFDELYSRWRNRVYSYLGKKSASWNLNPECVDDLFQRSFLKLHQTRHQYESRYPFSAWIFTLSRNTLVDYYRSEKNKTGADLANLKDAPLSEVAIEADAKLDIQTLLQSLPVSDRKVLEMRYLEDFGFDEIANRLSSSESAIRQKISRALRKLKRGQNHE
jgi:RNA polymerase sigma factor (sigma-70 family)